jgi:hypothetical protein
MGFRGPRTFPPRFHREESNAAILASIRELCSVLEVREDHIFFTLSFWKKWWQDSKEANFATWPPSKELLVRRERGRSNPFNVAFSGLLYIVYTIDRDPSEAVTVLLFTKVLSIFIIYKIP